MDFLGGIFLFIFLVIIIYPNFNFYKELKRIGKNQLKYKITYFIITLLISCSIVIGVAMLVVSQIINDFLNVTIQMNEYVTRIIFAGVIFPPGIFLNIYFGKFYLKRISRKKTEIELIGKE